MAKDSRGQAFGETLLQDLWQGFQTRVGIDTVDPRLAVPMDELHFQVTAPRDLAADNLRTLRRYLSSPLFRRRLLQAVRGLFTHNVALTVVRIHIVR